MIMNTLLIIEPNTSYQNRHEKFELIETYIKEHPYEFDYDIHITISAIELRDELGLMVVVCILLRLGIPFHIF